jgi:hypothetical protein
MAMRNKDIGQMDATLLIDAPTGIAFVSAKLPGLFDGGAKFGLRLGRIGSLGICR